MNRRTRFLSSFLFVAALAAPATLNAAAAPRTSRQPANLHRDNGGQLSVQVRIYDPQHRDYHDWNDNEERAYRQFLNDTRREYREFARMDEREQAEYWNWRHGHPDRDPRGDRPPGRYYDDSGRDYHDWNDNEDRAYREFLAERRWEYREFSQMNQHEQQEYWAWRHGHPDRGNSGGRRYYDQNTGQYHDWNDNEDRAYHRFMDENRRQYVDFDRADLSLQLQFWMWRQQHPDGGDHGQRRFYDNNSRDWHDWNDREESVYRSFLISTGRPYLEFSVIGPDVQVRYWAWRHAHGDPDDRGFRSYFDPGHNDWHIWDENEERAYRTFMNGRHWYYREPQELLPRDQQRYFDWRHKYPDHR